jgi:hypothetical protein
LPQDTILDADVRLSQMKADLLWLRLRLARQGDEHGAKIAERLVRDCVKTQQLLALGMDEPQEVAA